MESFHLTDIWKVDLFIHYCYNNSNNPLGLSHNYFFELFETSNNLLASFFCSAFQEACLPCSIYEIQNSMIHNSRP